MIFPRPVFVRETAMLETLGHCIRSGASTERTTSEWPTIHSEPARKRIATAARRGLKQFESMDYVYNPID